jgi:hypothetical protein
MSVWLVNIVLSDWAAKHIKQIQSTYFWINHFLYKFNSSSNNNFLFAILSKTMQYYVTFLITILTSLVYFLQLSKRTRQYFYLMLQRWFVLKMYHHQFQGRIVVYTLLLPQFLHKFHNHFQRKVQNMISWYNIYWGSKFLLNAPNKSTFHYASLQYFSFALPDSFQYFINSKDVNFAHLSFTIKNLIQ